MRPVSRLWTCLEGVSFFSLLLLSLSSLTNGGGSPTCALYDPLTPGITCFQGSQVLRALTNSPSAWMLEMYSSWCGHCQRFAPVLKAVAKEIEPWSAVFKIGIMECAFSKANNEACGKMEIQAYPTIRV